MRIELNIYLHFCAFGDFEMFLIMFIIIVNFIDEMLMNEELKNNFLECFKNGKNIEVIYQGK
jgi:hypothetical protein